MIWEVLAATVGVVETSEEEVNFSEMFGVCTRDPVSINFDFIFETGGAKGILVILDESGVESRIKTVSGIKLLVTGFFGSIQYTVSSQVFESEVSIVEYFKLISVLYFIKLQWKLFQDYRSEF